jgi:xylulokinase
MFLLGYDVGSSSIKATLLEAETGRVLAAATSPKTEMEMSAVKAGWAEQSPEVWWEHVKLSTAEILSRVKIDVKVVKAIGISYQMHGLVIVDKARRVLRPSIIWCDSRAVEIGEKAFRDIGPEKCLKQFLNSPGNFTASKLAWVKQNEPQIFGQIHKAMLPGDYIAMRMTGEINTTPSGLSEGIVWDFQEQDLAITLLHYFGISTDLIPEVAPTFSVQGELTKSAADELGLHAGTKIAYRAGDQPNNALSLNVLNPGELAATAGTSGVVYGVGDKPDYDPKSRVNTFVHVNHAADKPRYGVLLCVNGTGILNRWLKENFFVEAASGLGYSTMNEIAARAPAGSAGLVILPFGNGAERTLENKDIGASVHGLNFNVHNRSHVFRAAQEGIVFALNYGVDIMRGMGIQIHSVRAGHANMFLSPIFAETFATATGAIVELFDTDGSQGAARGAGIGAGVYKSYKEAFTGLRAVNIVKPNSSLAAPLQEAYAKWRRRVELQTSMVDG